MENNKIEEALNFLESQGFFVQNLWHVKDVQEKFDCTEEEAIDVLEKAVNGEWIMVEINNRIWSEGYSNNLKELK